MSSDQEKTPKPDSSKPPVSKPAVPKPVPPADSKAAPAPKPKPKPETAPPAVKAEVAATKPAQSEAAKPATPPPAPKPTAAKPIAPKPTAAKPTTPQTAKAKPAADHPEFVTPDGPFRRFRLSRRIEHIFLFTSFIVLAVTGLPQKYHSQLWSQELTLFLGGIETIRIVHRFAAAILMGVSIYHLQNAIYGLLRKKITADMVPNKKDLTDLIHMLKFFVGRVPDRPKFDRFNYIEKFDYWAVFWGMFIMAGSGLILWFPTKATMILPGTMIPIAKVAHSDEALLAISAIVIWHMYNAHFNPRIFPWNPSIFSGQMSPEQMMEEHPLEYTRKTGVESVAPPDLEAHIPWSRIFISTFFGVLTIALLGWLIVLALMH